MKSQKRIVLIIILAFILLIPTKLFAGGQADTGSGQTDWPKQPVQIYVGANPGGGIDTAARLMGKYLEKELGATFVVSNMAGGAGSIAARQVQNSRPDGYTMLVCHEALLTNKISGITDFDYDGFEAGGLCLKVYSTCMLSRKYKTFDALLEAARRNPGKIRFGTEIATNDTAIIAMIENEKKVRFQIIDSGAVSDQIASMMGDHIDFMKAPVGLAKDYIASKAFNILGFFNENRNAKYPGVPAMKEKGINFVVDKFFFCGFPKGTSPAIIAKFTQALKNVASNRAFVAEAENIDYAVDYMSPQEIPAYFELCKARLQEYQTLLDNR
ncbi:MAG: tripartite tricarboxylate transporter substrate binding protein [Spirochaetales bacterium]|jgi:tripartite-type tricarboxylate transporter receptor subunit TctC|nr:tripartite tricarboxylate transporter substrate binding protein [Spirochaetales bacterium]